MKKYTAKIGHLFTGNVTRVDEGEQEREDVITYFKKTYGLEVKLKWNDHSACHCGCSPGFDIVAQLHQKAPTRFKEESRFYIWMDNKKPLEIRKPENSEAFNQLYYQ